MPSSRIGLRARTSAPPLEFRRSGGSKPLRSKSAQAPGAPQFPTKTAQKPEISHFGCTICPGLGRLPALSRTSSESITPGRSCFTRRKLYGKSHPGNRRCNISPASSCKKHGSRSTRMQPRGSSSERHCTATSRLLWDGGSAAFPCCNSCSCFAVLSKEGTSNDSSSESSALKLPCSFMSSCLCFSSRSTAQKDSTARITGRKAGVLRGHLLLTPCRKIESPLGQVVLLQRESIALPLLNPVTSALLWGLLGEELQGLARPGCGHLEAQDLGRLSLASEALGLGREFGLPTKIKLKREGTMSVPRPGSKQPQAVAFPGPT